MILVFSTGLGSALISVLDVDVSPDLRNATVKVSIFKTEDQKSDALGYLKGRRKAIKGILSQNFREMKRVPELRFVEADVGTISPLERHGHTPTQPDSRFSEFVTLTGGQRVSNTGAAQRHERTAIFLNG